MIASARHEPAIPSSVRVVAWWGVLGVIALLAFAIWRLTPIALQPIREGTLTFAQAAAYLGWVMLNAYTEGYRAFQLRFAPRVVVRALHLAHGGRPLHLALAPLFCMSYFHATRRARIVAWTTTLLIVLLVIAVGRLPQPWRGIIDGGVVVGLSWGTLSIVYFFVRSVCGRPPSVSGDLPAAPAEADAAARRPPPEAPPRQALDS